MEKALLDYELEVKTKAIFKLKKELIDLKYDIKTRNPKQDGEVIKYIEDDIKRIEKTIADLEA